MVLRDREVGSREFEEKEDQADTSHQKKVALRDRKVGFTWCSHRACRAGPTSREAYLDKHCPKKTREVRFPFYSRRPALARRVRIAICIRCTNIT